MTMTKHRKTLATLVVVATTGAASAVALAEDSPTPEITPAEANAKVTRAVASVQPQISDNFALFRNQPASAVPAELVEQIASPQRHGRNAALARTIQTPYGTGWVVPGDGFVCIAVPTTTQGHATSCVPTAVALKRGLWLRLVGDRADGKALDTLMVPDRTEVRVHGATDDTALVPSSNGVVGELVDTDGSGPRLVPED